MKVSVIVPVYNVEKYIRECVDSLINQRFDEYEILLIDDGSTDLSSSICDEYSKRSELVKTYHKKNGGLSSARNYGLEKAKGEWVVFVDSDDYWLSDDVLQTLFKIATDNSTDFVRFEYTAVDEYGNFLYEHCYDKKTHLLNKALTQYQMFHYGIAGEFFAVLYMARKELFLNLRFSESRKFQEDIDLCIRLFATKRFLCSYCKERFYAYRKRRNSITSTPVISNLEGSFTLADVFHNYSLSISDKRLRAEYHYYSVMMYYWTLCTFLETPYFENRSILFRELNVRSLHRITLKRMIKYKIFNKSTFLMVLGPHITVILLYVRCLLKNLMH